MTLRTETRRRARVLQMLCSLEFAPGSDVRQAARGLARLTGPAPGVLDDAIAETEAIIHDREAIDRHAQQAADNWRLERVATVERNILRIGIHELLEGVVPARVVIDESLWLTHRFAGARAPAFVNGVLDRIARNLGRL